MNQHDGDTVGTCVRPWRPSVPDFCAIDFETANENSNSACALGVVRVVGGRIVGTASWRIRPPTPRFTFTYIHGLTWNHVESASPLNELWPLVEPWLRDCRFIAAHNATFDENVLETSIRPFALDLTTLPPFLCTVSFARFIWGDWARPTTLSRIAKLLDIPLTHHDPRSDALACAMILLRAQREWSRKISSQSEDPINLYIHKVLA